MSADYGSGGGLALAGGYNLTPDLSVAGLFGWHAFRADAAGVDDTYRLSLTGGLKYRFASPRARPFVRAGLGAYLPEVGGASLGGHVGIGLDYDLQAPVTLTAALDFHSVFGESVEFVSFSLGAIVRP